VSIRALAVLGTRPEAIKLAPLVQRMARDARFAVDVCATGQHREMLDGALAAFAIEPRYDLDVMAPDQDLFEVTTRVLAGMRGVLRDARPDVVLVHGDTTTAMAAALAAHYVGVHVAHVEAGLRSGDLRAPFPEELNRAIADRIARWHFAPTEGARRNLLAERIDERRIFVTGNTVIDALLWMHSRVAGKSARDFEAQLGAELAALLDHWSGRIVLVTGHRRESFGAPFEALCAAITDCARRHPHWLFVYPVHPNPNVQRTVRAGLGGLGNVVLGAPLDYAPFVWLLNRCDVVLTDSGGLQEEAPSLGKPVLVARDVTERPEAVEAGVARLVGTDPRRIGAALEELLDPRAQPLRVRNPYGDGRAAERIVETLARECAGVESGLAASA
jgi:UDP-N-acetylglucosamine 2-epimerase (non-hydrolysing)